MVYLDYAWKILFVVVFFGLCIFVHELGHLLVALWRGLYVERFSVGFGKKIWGVTHRGVEYVVSWLPFGGYVALPQLDPTDIPHTSTGEPLPVPSAASRALTAAAGPVANVIFGFALATVTWCIGLYEPAPATECTVREVPQILPLYEHGLKPGDTILAVDGREVKGAWDQVSKSLTYSATPLALRVQRKAQTLDLTYRPTPNPEYLAGLRPGDRIVAVDGQGFRRGWDELSETIVLSTDDLTLSIERVGDGRREITYTPARNPMTEGLGYPFFTVISPTEVAYVQPGSAAAAAGFRKGDRLLRVNDQVLVDKDMFIDTVKTSEGAPLDIVIRRDGKEMTVAGVRARPATDETGTVYRVGLTLQAPFVLGHPTPWAQCVEVLARTQRTLGSLVAPVTGRKSLVRVGHMSGPLGIVGMIWIKIVTEGIRGGLAIIIMVTFSLALFNLLPIPVLDGGHILYSGIEALIRRRLPTRLVSILQYTFAYSLIALMLYITFRDVQRIPKLWRAYNGSSESEAPAAPTPPPAPAPAAAETGPE